MFRTKSGCQPKISSNCEKFDVNFRLHKQEFYPSRFLSWPLSILVVTEMIWPVGFSYKLCPLFLEALLSNFHNTMWPENVDGNLIEYIFIDVAH